MSLFRSIWRGQGGGSTGGGSASDITFNPAGLKVLKGTNVQSALNETDNALADLQDSVSILATSVPLANTIGADTVIMLDELTALEIDGRPNYKLPGATVFAPNGQQGIIHSVDSDNQSATVKTTVLSDSGGGSGTDNNGLEGDYCSKYGIVDETASGLPTQGTGNQLIIPAQLVMDIPGVPGLTTNTTKITHDLTSTTNCEIFLAEGTVIEATEVYWQVEKPEDGQTGYLAWWNGTEWKFKSNDTGNVWRAANAVRIAKCIFTDGSLTRLCFTGCRVLNKQEWLPLSGGTMTGTIAFAYPTNKLYAPQIMNSNARLFVGSSINQDRFVFDMAGTGTLYPGGYSSDLGNNSHKWRRVYGQNLNNGADIAVPTTGGTMALVEDITPIQDHSVIEFQAPTADNNYTWYRKYKDGCVEQGGNIEFTSNPQSISLPVEMTDANYTATAISNASSASGWAQITSKTTTGLSVGMYYGNGTNSVTGGERNISWQVLGMYKRD